VNGVGPTSLERVVNNECNAFQNSNHGTTANGWSKSCCM
jgi:hypothetical protein